MEEPRSLKELLVGKMISAIAMRGLETVSLRTVAADANATTAAIVHHFRNKQGLVHAALQEALRIDQAFHDEFAARLDGLRLNHSGFSDLVAGYILARAEHEISRFWAEILFKSRQVEGAGPFLHQRQQLCRAFWANILGNNGVHVQMAPVIARYVAMEECYAFVHDGDFEYGLLLRETARALMAASFGIIQSDGCEARVSEWLNARPYRFPAHSQAVPDSMPDRLLDIASADILDEGIECLNQRRLASKLGVASSMVVYHFGTMAAFATEAIWRAMVVRSPRTLQFYREGPDQFRSINNWIGSLIDAISPREDFRGAGFYVGYSRITGQTALLARQQPELMDLVRHLRTIDGLGTFSSIRNLLPPSHSADHGRSTAFAIWIKGAAIFNEALDRDCRIGESEITQAFHLIFGIAG